MPYFKWEIPEIGFKSRKCLRFVVTEQSAQLLRLYRHWQNGRLLCGGGILDQPAKYLDAMELIEVETARVLSKQDG